MSTHGMNTYFALDDAGGVLRDISVYTDNVDFPRSNDVHDDTTFGQTGHTFRGGLTDGQIGLGGLWDKTTDVGPGIVFPALLGHQAPEDFEYGPEGDTAGMVKRSGKYVLQDYQESSPVADLVRWTATLKISGAVTNGVFSA